MTKTIWINDPLILLKKEKIFELVPNNLMNLEEKINAVSRLIIILTLVSYMLSNSINIIIGGLVALAVLILYYNLVNKNNNKAFLKNVINEGFTNPELYNMLKDNYTNPKENNPLMNVLVNEIQDNPERKSAAPSYNPVVESKINESTKQFIKNSFDDENINNKLFKNLGDNLEFENSMRNFHSNPVTQTPNDQKGFADFCFGTLPSEKNIQVF